MGQRANKFEYNPESHIDQLIGIHLVGETHTTGQELTPNQGVCLGFIISSVNKTLNLVKLRNTICSQLPTLPAEFQFLTKQRWPVLRNQESRVHAIHVISEGNVVLIQRAFEHPRIAIKTSENHAVGFVFVDLNWSLTNLRQVITQQLGNVSGSLTETYYQFLDANGWPISFEQEEDMAIVDILSGSYVRVKVCLSGISPVSSSVPGSALILNSPKQNSKRRFPKLKRQLTFGTGKDEVRHVHEINSVDGGERNSKLILISYVRAEAAEHALNLKAELTKLNLSVFLDIHEIKFGVDWQDSLNYAVSTCEVFVPLVTPRYGETQWTNREVKLADVLNKSILPINFGDKWPPKCLAIQFATTQFIPWKTKDQIKTEIEYGIPESEVLDTNIWNKKYIKSVAREVYDRLQNLVRKTDTQQIRTLNNKRQARSLRSYPVKLPANLGLGCVNEAREGNPLVVISLHPQQREFGESLRVILSAEGYDVWCTGDEEEDFRANSKQRASRMQSQDSDISNVEELSMSSFAALNVDPRKRAKGKKFQEMADEAGVVIFVLSKAFSVSKMCQQQVFYCEHRKHYIPLKYETFCMPSWMSMLIGTSTFEDANRNGFEQSLVARVRSALVQENTGNSTPTELREKKLGEAVSRLMTQLPKTGCVYISGGSKFYYKDSEAICKAIGCHLAQIPNVTLVTNGFFGVGNTVGTSFYEHRQSMDMPQDVWHILPEQDTMDQSQKARQGSDNNFERVPYGETVYTGGCVREREDVVARAFQLCVLVEGGAGAAHEAEQFSWNDHIVIPVKVTGGAAGGKFNVPQKIFQVPQGVSLETWATLSSSTASPDEIGQAVAEIVETLVNRNEQLDETDSNTTANTTTAEVTPDEGLPPTPTSSSPAPRPQSITLQRPLSILKSPSPVSPNPGFPGSPSTKKAKPTLTKLKTLILDNGNNFGNHEGLGGSITKL